MRADALFLKKSIEELEKAVDLPVGSVVKFTCKDYADEKEIWWRIEKWMRSLVTCRQCGQSTPRGKCRSLENDWATEYTCRACLDKALNDRWEITMWGCKTCFQCDQSFPESEMMPGVHTVKDSPLARGGQGRVWWCKHCFHRLFKPDRGAAGQIAG